VKAVINRFKNDDRILLWDLYNEPTNGGLGSATFPLLKKVVRWARAVNPTQPLSIDVWNGDKRLNEIALAASDVITFHNYGNKDALVKHINELKAYNRPLLCTEWMNRPAGSVIATHLPVFYAENVGSMLWAWLTVKPKPTCPGATVRLIRRLPFGSTTCTIRTLPFTNNRNWTALSYIP
jgi:hypothetical protein